MPGHDGSILSLDTHSPHTTCLGTMGLSYILGILSLKNSSPHTTCLGTMGLSYILGHLRASYDMPRHDGPLLYPWTLTRLIRHAWARWVHPILGHLRASYDMPGHDGLIISLKNSSPHTACLGTMDLLYSWRIPRLIRHAWARWAYYILEEFLASYGMPGHDGPILSSVPPIFTCICRGLPSLCGWKRVGNCLYWRVTMTEKVDTQVLSITGSNRNLPISQATCFH